MGQRVEFGCDLFKNVGEAVSYCVHQTCKDRGAMPLAEPRWRDSKLCAGSCGTRLARTAQRGVITERDGKFADSPMEESGFEPLVPLEKGRVLRAYRDQSHPRILCEKKRHRRRWDREFESGLLQRRFYKLSVPSESSAPLPLTI